MTRRSVVWVARHWRESLSCNQIGTRTTVVIKLPPEIEAALIESARRQGVSPEALANSVLRERFISAAAVLVPRDEWERAILGLASDCGVSLPHSALSSEGLYE